tara:strand:+ start:752 stop:1024 length:273 start_codon:yes stop_codon:yes gene_type:complete
MDLTKYLNQFNISTEIKMWIQSSLAIGLNLNELTKIVKSNTDIDGEVPNIIELVIATSRITNLNFRYGSQDYKIRDGNIYDNGDSKYEDA